MGRPTDEREYDGTGTGHEPYGEPGYREGGGQRGQEVADALEADLAETYGADEPASEHLSERMLREEHQSSDAVPRFTEDDLAVEAGGNDQFADATPGEINADRHELSAEESAMHYIEGDDPIPE